ncbi:MAG: hypothetical protein GY711_09130 [bacterium]|nr:hypothetical protein [bacterium]
MHSMTARFALAPLVAPLLALALPALGHSQSVFVDFGSTSVCNGTVNVPTCTYAAAGGLSGTWNSYVATTGPSLALIHNTCTPVSAGATVAATVTNSCFLGSPAMGNDAALMEDYDTVVSETYVFDGLVPGVYDVYTYAWLPNSSTTTIIDVHGSGSQTVGGAAWTVPMSPLLHYAHHVVSPINTTITVEASAATPFSTGAVNGIQVVLRAGQPVACATNPNSTGAPASIGAFGQTTTTGVAWTSFDDIVLRCTSVPAGEPGIFFVGPSTIGAAPFGEGFRCVGGSVVRLPFVVADASGVMTHPLVQANDLATFTPLSGVTLYTQAWYRDPAGALPPNFAGFNLSDAIGITWL